VDGPGPVEGSFPAGPISLRAPKWGLGVRYHSLCQHKVPSGPSMGAEVSWV
jgi:hypothetical protein